MKTSIAIRITILALICVSCSSDDTETPLEPQPVLTKFIVENYNTVNDPNTINTRRSYTIENNKIVSYQRESLDTGTLGNRTYTYDNGKISEISSFTDGLLTELKHFSYNNDGNLIEYYRELTENSDPQAVYIKHNFIHTQDTIYGTLSQSTDGINFSTNYTSKIVLDSNLNNTFSELTSADGSSISRTIKTYDANNNVLSIMGFEMQDDGSFFNTISSSYTYETGMNTLGLIYEATFGRDVLMLSNQHLDNSSALNSYNSKYTTFNTFDTFTSTFFGNVNIAPEFINTYNDDNYSILSDYKMSIEGSLFSRFTIEYIFE